MVPVGSRWPQPLCFTSERAASCPRDSAPQHSTALILTLELRALPAPSPSCIPRVLGQGGVRNSIMFSLGLSTQQAPILRVCANHLLLKRGVSARGGWLELDWRSPPPRVRIYSISASNPLHVRSFVAKTTLVSFLSLWPNTLRKSSVVRKAFISSYVVPAHHWGKPGQELEAGTWGRSWSRDNRGSLLYNVWEWPGWGRAALSAVHF